MKKKSKIIIPALALGIFTLVGIYGARSIFADESNFHDRMAEELSQRFNLDEKEVKSFLNERRDEREKERRARQEERLTQAVADGKITEEQKQAILKKIEEMRQERESMAGLSWEEREAEREKHRDEMEKWAQENGINLSQIMPLMGGDHRGMKKGL